MKKFSLKLILVCIFTFISLTVTAAIQNGGFETGSFTNWTLTGNGAFGDSPRSELRFNQPTEGSYYADSGFNASNEWVETNTGVLQSDNFILGPDEVVLFDIGGWSKWGGGGFEHCYVGLFLAADGSELDRAWTPNANDAVPANLLYGTNIDMEVYIKVVDDGTNAGYAWLSVDNFMILDTVDPNFDFENGYMNWDVTGPAWGNGPATTNYFPLNSVGFGCHGDYFALSLAGGETATGTIKSINFTLPKDSQLNFMICGWSYTPPDATPTYNYVTVKKVSDDTQIGDIVYAPGADSLPLNSFVDAVVSNTTGIDQEVYIEAVDNADGSGYAWFGIDYFQIETPEPDAPMGVSATKGSTNDRVIVTWYFDAEATKYIIYRNTVANTNTIINISGELGDVTQFDDTTAFDNSNYYYWVQAGNSFGWSPLSDYDTGFRTDSTGPDKPVNISPVDGSEPDFPISLAASAYSDSGGWPFVTSEWHISSSAGFSPIIKILTDAVTNITPPTGDLYSGTNYWRVRYGNTKNKWSDWSDATTFIFQRDTNSAFYFYETFNNIPGSGDVNKAYYVSGRQYGTAAPLDYSIVGSTEVGMAATIPNKLVLNGTAGCSPNFSFDDYTEFKIVFDVEPHKLDGSADYFSLCFGKSTQNSLAPNSISGAGLVFPADGKFYSYDSETQLIGGSTIPTNKEFEIEVTASVIDFDNGTAVYTVFANGDPMIQNSNYGYVDIGGFEKNYITMFSSNSVSANPTVVDTVSIQETYSKITVTNWTSDADSFVESSKTYTHAVNLNGDNIDINGVTFHGTPGGSFAGTNFPNGSEYCVSNGSWEMMSSQGGVYFISGGSIVAADGITGNSQTFAENFCFWGSAMVDGNSFAIKLSGLAPFSSNRMTIYTYAWEDANRECYFNSSAGGIIDKVNQDTYGTGNGLIMQYDYIALADGTFTLISLPPVDASFHVSGFSNEETAKAEPQLDVDRHLYFGEVVVGNSKTVPLDIRNIGGGVVAGTISGAAPEFSLTNIYYATALTSDIINVVFTPTSDGNYTNVITLSGSGGSAEVELKGTGVPEPISVIGNLLSVIGLIFVVSRTLDPRTLGSKCEQ